MVKTFASSNDIRWRPDTAVNEKKAIGAQHKKSVKTKRAIRLAIRESFEFQALNGLTFNLLFKQKESNYYLRSSDRTIHSQITPH